MSHPGEDGVLNYLWDFVLDHALHAWRAVVSGVLQLVAATSGGWDVYRDLNLGTTGQILKASGGQVGGWYLFNGATATRYLKLYNKATAPSHADTPVLTIPIPAGSAANVEYTLGLDKFPDGISCRATTGVADNDANAPGANEVIVNILFK